VTPLAPQTGSARKQLIGPVHVPREVDPGHGLTLPRCACTIVKQRPRTRTITIHNWATLMDVAMLVAWFLAEVLAEEDVRGDLERRMFK